MRAGFRGRSVLRKPARPQRGRARSPGGRPAPMRFLQLACFLLTCRCQNFFDNDTRGATCCGAQHEEYNCIVCHGGGGRVRRSRGGGLQMHDGQRGRLPGPPVPGRQRDRRADRDPDRGSRSEIRRRRKTRMRRQTARSPSADSASRSRPAPRGTTRLPPEGPRTSEPTRRPRTPPTTPGRRTPARRRRIPAFQ